MNRTRLVCIGVLVANWLTTVAGAAEPQPIPEVRHVSDLANQKPIATGNGWEVRLGIAGGGEEAGPWRLLYCLAKWTGEAADVKDDGVIHGGETSLGPIRYTVRDGRRVLHALEKIREERRLPKGEELYCDLILTAWQGEYLVDVHSVGGKLLAQCKFEVDKPRTCYWHQFARATHWAKASPLDGTVRHTAHAAVPKFYNRTPIWRPDQRLPLDSAAMLPLPGSVPTDTTWLDHTGPKRPPRRGKRTDFALTLCLEKDAFVLRSIVPLKNWPDRLLLARWWVNDRPVVPKVSHEAEREELLRLTEPTKRIDIAAGLPSGLGELKPGDKVGLQLLYSPGMFKKLREGRHAARELEAMAEVAEEAVRFPLLSNRTDFKVTAELLAKRSKQAAAEAAE